ncbi:MAG: hypothetical protein ABIK13_03165 [Patescibacteria group bacterium]
MAKKKVSDIERGAGFFQALITSIMDVAREGDVPFEAIHRLTTPAGRAALVDMVDIAHTDYLDDRTYPKPPVDSLPPHHYRVFVDYTMPRDMGVFEAEFSKSGVSVIFSGDHEWQPHPSCIDIDQTSGNRIMLVKHFGRALLTESAIAEMDTLGYRPAIHLEAYAFAKGYPELQRQFWIAALGSSMQRDGQRYAAVLDIDFGRRMLDSCRFDDEWDAAGRFLFVRKDA